MYLVRMTKRTSTGEVWEVEGAYYERPTGVAT